MVSTSNETRHNNNSYVVVLRSEYEYATCIIDNMPN